MNKKQFLAFTGITALASGFIYMRSNISLPKGVTPVTPFDAERYLGKWYEIARLDFAFEKNLNNTTAEYSLNDNGSIRVINRGYNYERKEWDEAVGKAKFVETPNTARLKVSFFGPFYAAYHVAALDDDYQYALVIGKSPKYCWILARAKTIPNHIKEKYVQKAKEIGVKTENLIWVKHND